LHNPLGVLLFADVGVYECGLAASGYDLLGNTVAADVIDIGDNDARATLGQLLHGCFADTGTSTGHCEDLAGKSRRHNSTHVDALSRDAIQS
jgi:hypothetical protein